MLSVSIRTAAASFRLAPTRLRLIRPVIATCQTRNISSNDVFKITESASIPDLPPLPTPPIPGMSVDELIASGASVLEELGLWTWWKPSSYFRWALESSFCENFRGRFC